ncbi:hypothetical protein Q4578_16755 [Shimia thalassica]|uniref:hypothetical protein n=1 Tax=Shimia thalassica TaxID=1715693 RepID=UPI0026E2AF8F|nr:hypothetical protein [Shimia thalassica]MDO6523249.1 hypothetical protein [Shimia thalassica]
MTKPQEVQTLKVGHITFRVTNCPRGGVTYALIPHEAFHAKDRKVLFSGHVERGMGKQLRRLAHVFDDLEKGLSQPVKGRS